MPERPIRLAYVIGTYPVPTTTFIDREKTVSVTIKCESKDSIIRNHSSLQVFRMG